MLSITLNPSCCSCDDETFTETTTQEKEAEPQRFLTDPFELPEVTVWEFAGHRNIRRVTDSLTLILHILMHHLLVLKRWRGV